jgi:hypothetical protein
LSGVVLAITIAMANRTQHNGSLDGHAGELLEQETALVDKATEAKEDIIVDNVDMEMNTTRRRRQRCRGKCCCFCFCCCCCRRRRRRRRRR